MNADLPATLVHFIGDPDPHINFIDGDVCKIGITGVAAAVANAIFHATQRANLQVADYTGQLVVSRSSDE